MTMPAAPSRRFSVCLLASHPMVVAEFQRLLSHMPVRVQPKNVDAVFPDAACIPRAGVYVIDSEGHQFGVEALVAKIIQRYPSARLLLVGREFTHDIACPLLRLGVKGLLQHSQLADQLERALQSLAAGGYWVPRTLLTKFVESVLKKTSHSMSMSSRAGLTRREKEVIQGVLDNLTNKEIASKLNISERTVKFHVSNLLQKFNVRRRADLIVLGYQESSRTSNSLSLGAATASTRVH
jgi:two-component system nitrate/nitrite response regulator NarL